MPVRDVPHRRKKVHPEKFSVVDQARAFSLQHFLEWRGSPQRLGPDLRHAVKVLLGFTPQELDRAVEILHRWGKLQIFTSASGVRIALIERGEVCPSGIKEAAVSCGEKSLPDDVASVSGAAHHP